MASEVKTINYQIDRSWSDNAAKIKLGQATGVAIDSSNNVFVFHRASRKWQKPMPSKPIVEDTIYKISGSTGKRLASWGSNEFIMPHGLSIDKNDNVWITDVGSHLVQKFSKNGAHLLTLGTRGKAGNDETHFNLPTDIGFSKTGDIFVTDGYKNNRVVKFSKAGVYKKDWGHWGLWKGTFRLPHGIAVSKKGLVYVADRRNKRLQVFNEEGDFQYILKSSVIGRPYGVTTAPNGDVFIVDGGNQPSDIQNRMIHLDRNGKYISSFNANHDGQKKVLGHDIALGKDGAVYVVDALANRILKLVRTK